MEPVKDSIVAGNDQGISVSSQPSQADAKTELADSLSSLKSASVRSYLDQTVVPILMDGLSELIKER